jgi:hypothetical protein
MPGAEYTSPKAKVTVGPRTRRGAVCRPCSIVPTELVSPCTSVNTGISATAGADRLHRNSLGWRDQPADTEHGDNQQHDEREHGEAHAAARPSERVPHFLVQVEPARLRLANDGPFPQSAQSKPMPFVQIVEAQRACR